MAMNPHEQPQQDFVEKAEDLYFSENKSMKSPHPQPSKEGWEDDLYTLVHRENIAHTDGKIDKCTWDEILDLIQSLLKEEYSRGYHDGRGERDFTGREVSPKAL